MGPGLIREITMEVGEWVQVLFERKIGKSSQNSPIHDAPVFWGSIPCVSCLYFPYKKLLVIMIWVFCPCHWWVFQQKLWIGVWWVRWALSSFVLHSHSTLSHISVHTHLANTAVLIACDTANRRVGITCMVRSCMHSVTYRRTGFAACHKCATFAIQPRQRTADVKAV